MIEKTGSFFHISGKNISYVIALTETGEAVQAYFGKKIRVNENYKPNFTMESEKWEPVKEGTGVYERTMLEYPSYGYPDLHIPAYEVQNSDGNSISQLLYKEHKILDGVCEIDGLPTLLTGDKQAQTLEITLEDKLTGLNVILSYTVFEEYNIVAKSVKFVNTSDKMLKLNSAYSSCLTLKVGEYDEIHFPGAWAREREFTRNKIEQGACINIANAYGYSGHQMNPFVMVAEKNADENNGNVYSMSLIYSGNHSTLINCDNFNRIRMMQGINPFGFEWELKSGENFSTPQSVVCFSDCGIGGISRELSDLYKDNLCRSKWVHKERPILINNWEATYFDFNEDKLLEIAKKAKETGIEMFVLDDGWFGVRDSDNCSLGDWVVDKRKLPNGIASLADKINDLGLKFGLWFEPEMISPDSDLFRAHPDWAIQVKGREIVQSRNQYVLDLSNDDVCEYVIKAVSDVLSSANISYVKWDMNRPMINMPCGGYNHKYMLGFYKIMSAITGAFPEILFEGCAGGGGRFDAGVLAYMPQIWTSDNSDAIARLKIQYSTSIAYPSSAISAHVTASPNHQNGRVTPLKTRADVAYAGIFGYELDITKMSDDEIEEVKKQIEYAKKLRALMIDCDFYRLQSPYETNNCTWETVSKDKKEAFVMTCRVLTNVHTKLEEGFKLCGLDPNADYRDENTGIVYGGDVLMYQGIVPEYGQHDFASITYHFVRV